jgi:hypothetical protein
MQRLYSGNEQIMNRGKTRIRQTQSDYKIKNPVNLVNLKYRDVQMPRVQDAQERPVYIF